MQHAPRKAVAWAFFPLKYNACFLSEPLNTLGPCCPTNTTGSLLDGDLPRQGALVVCCGDCACLCTALFLTARLPFCEMARGAGAPGG